VKEKKVMWKKNTKVSYSERSRGKPEVKTSNKKNQPKTFNTKSKEDFPSLGGMKVEENTETSRQNTKVSYSERVSQVNTKTTTTKVIKNDKTNQGKVKTSYKNQPKTINTKSKEDFPSLGGQGTTPPPIVKKTQAPVWETTPTEKPKNLPPGHYSLEDFILPSKQETKKKKK